MRLRNQTPLRLLLLVAIPALLMGCGSSAENAGAMEPGASAEPPDAPKEDDGGMSGTLSELLADVDPPRSYEMKSIPPGGGEPMTMIFRMDGRRPEKAKMVQADGWMLFDQSADATYMYQASENVIMKMPSAGGRESLEDPWEHVDPGATVLGKERIDGSSCWIIASTIGDFESKVWVGVDDGLPRQFETDQGLTRFVYSRINQIEDTEFDLPKGIRSSTWPG